MVDQHVVLLSGEAILTKVKTSRITQMGDIAFRMKCMSRSHGCERATLTAWRVVKPILNLNLGHPCRGRMDAGGTLTGVSARVELGTETESKEGAIAEERLSRRKRK